MANSLNIDLTGQVVVFKEGVMKAVYDRHHHLFLVSGGFGSQPDTNGRMIGGTFLSDGEDTAFSGYDVERLATREEIEALGTEWAMKYLASEDFKRQAKESHGE